MLKHEDNSQTPFPSAAQVRVTPEELAAAITALQIRKEGQPGTIAIGDAVEELGLRRIARRSSSGSAGPADEQKAAYF